VNEWSSSASRRATGPSGWGPRRLLGRSAERASSAGVRAIRHHASVSEFPPPTGRPVASASGEEPWAAHARQRRDQRVAQRRRRQRLRIVSGVVVVFGLGAATTWWMTISEQSLSGAEPQLQTSIAVEAVEAVEVVGVVGVSIDDAISVDEVWLLDVGADAYGWGVVVSADEPVGELIVTAEFLDVDGESVGSEIETIVGLAGGESVIVGGSLQNDGGPARIALSIRFGETLSLSVQDSADTADSAVLEVLAAERVGVGTLDDDVLSGVVGVPDDAAGESVEVVAIWRDGQGVVAAAVFVEVSVAEAESEQDVPFEMTLQRRLIPTGLPSSVDVRWLG
jgi:hypothetical protein